jgi:hypothetical protein
MTKSNHSTDPVTLDSSEGAALVASCLPEPDQGLRLGLSVDNCDSFLRPTRHVQCSGMFITAYCAS